MHDATDFDVFVAIVDAGSISEASRELDVPRATLSRQLARLEERLGVRLLHRTTRSLTLSPAGEALYPRARKLIDGAKEAVEAVQRLDGIPRGRLRVSSSALDSRLTSALVTAYLQRYPDVSVELIVSARHVDLIEERVDVAVRGGVVRTPSLMTRQLLRATMVAVASPAYLDLHGPPETPEDLSGHACLRGFVEGVRPVTRWPTWGAGFVEVDGPLVTNDMVALRHAALGGLGVALLPAPMVADDLASGELVGVLEGRVGMNVSLSLVWPERELLEPKVRAFIDLATEWVAREGVAAPASPRTL